MALHQISHHFSGTRERASLPQTVHCGVVGSGDLEVLLEPKALAGGIEVTISTPMTYFDHIWEIVLKRFLENGPLGNMQVSINDNNATCGGSGFTNSASVTAGYAGRNPS